MIIKKISARANQGKTTELLKEATEKTHLFSIEHSVPSILSIMTEKEINIPKDMMMSTMKIDMACIRDFKDVNTVLVDYNIEKEHSQILIDVLENFGIEKLCYVEQLATR